MFQMTKHMFFISVILFYTLLPKCTKSEPDCNGAFITFLTHCEDFVDGTYPYNPSESCCVEVRSIMAQKSMCSCDIIKESKVLGIDISVMRTLHLPSYCNISKEPLDSCKNETALLSPSKLSELTPAPAPPFLPSSRPSKSPKLSRKPGPSETPNSSPKPGPSETPNFSPKPTSSESSNFSPMPGPSESPDFSPKSGPSSESPDFSLNPWPSSESPIFSPNPGPSSESPNFSPKPTSSESPNFSPNAVPSESPNFSPNPEPSKSPNFSPKPEPSESPNFSPKPGPSECPSFSPEPDCIISSLTFINDCMDYVDEDGPSNNPSKECCVGVRYIMKHYNACSCHFIKESKDLGIEINATRMRTLPHTCKVESAPLSSYITETAMATNRPPPVEVTQAPSPSFLPVNGPSESPFSSNLSPSPGPASSASKKKQKLGFYSLMFTIFLVASLFT